MLVAGAEDGIYLPVPELRAGRDGYGPGGDRPLPRQAAAAVVASVAFPALLPRPAEVRVQGPALALVGPDVAIDGLVADAQLPLPAEIAGHLLRTPLLFEEGADEVDVGRREALVPPGAGSPGACAAVREGWPVAPILPAVAVQFAPDRAPVAARRPGNGRRVVPELAEHTESVSFIEGDLSIHGSLHSLGGELKSTGLAGHLSRSAPCCT